MKMKKYEFENLTAKGLITIVAAEFVTAQLLAYVMGATINLIFNLLF